MNNKLLSIIIIIISFLIIIGIVFFLFFFNRNDNAQPADDTGNNSGLLDSSSDNAANKLNTLGETKVVKEVVPVKKDNVEPASEAEIKSTELLKTASAFAERWGSYSNHSDFNNLKDLKIFMTADMSDWVDTLIKDNRDNLGDTSVYQGLTTKTISTEMQSFNEEDGRAVVLVKTQKTAKSGNSGESTTSHEDVLITFVKEGNDWKVGRID